MVVWSNTDVRYLSSMLAHAYNIIIDRGVGLAGQDRYIVDVLHNTDKQLL